MNDILLPDIAWEQAVFVCLFLVFVILILRWASNREKNWQNFTVERDKFWQKWLEVQNEKANECMNDVTKILGGVSDNQLKMMKLLEDHDNNLEPRVEKLIENAQQSAKKRPRSTGSV